MTPLSCAESLRVPPLLAFNRCPRSQSILGHDEATATIHHAQGFMPFEP